MRSKMNKALLAAVDELEGVTINDLYACYPDFLIDVKREQQLCESHDVIIFQHPFYWYSTPSIMKEWLDLVLQHGWAYGSKGKALNGKYFLQAITAGGDDSTYQKDGSNRFTIRELTTPYQSTAKLCGMIWLPPFGLSPALGAFLAWPTVNIAMSWRATSSRSKDCCSGSFLSPLAPVSTSC